MSEAGPGRVLGRRSALVGLGAAVGAVLLAGCRSGGVSGGAGEGGASEGGASEGGASGTRTLDTAHGPVQVPAEPRRVVCTDFYTTYALLDVGFTPVGTAEATVGGVLPAQQAAYDALPKVGRTVEVNYEAVAALGPDLILGTQVPGLAADLHEKLSAIAPTALFAASSPGDWKQRAVRAADAVGRGEAGAALAGRYDERVAELRATHAAALRSSTWALVRATTTGAVFVDGPTSWSGVVLQDLGARFTRAAPTDTATTEISAERYDDLADADVVLYLADARGRADPRTAGVVDDPLFRRLVGARDDRILPLSSYYAAHYLDGEALLDQIEPVLADLA